MKIKTISALLALFLLTLLPQAVYADITLTATYTDKNGDEHVETDNFTAEAPLHVRFTSNPEGMEAGTTYEWHFQHQGPEGVTEVTRYEQDTEYDFLVSGVTVVTLLAMLNGEAIATATLNVTISDSHLEMPNAFSPNNDGTNDLYGAIGVNADAGGATESSNNHYKSIVEFHAYIFNRHGQKLYEWHDVAGSWDGTHNGRPVKDGVYYVLVKARGADGVEYNIRRDVNLLRKFNNTLGEGGTTSDE